MNDERPTHLDLFSGIGGFALAAQWAGFRTIGFSEVEPFACKILKRNWPLVPNLGDVRGVRGTRARLVTGGPPCQPASHAGERRGAEDDRWLWPEAIAVIADSECEAFLFENPLGLVSLVGGLEFERTLSALESLSYAVEPIIIPACGLNAKHERYRVWIIGYSDRYRQSTRAVDDAKSGVQGTGIRVESKRDCVQRWQADGTQGQSVTRAKQLPRHVFLGVRDAVSAARVWRAANGVSTRLDSARNRAIGNAIVPQVAYEILKAIKETMKANSVQSGSESDDASGNPK